MIFFFVDFSESIYTQKNKTMKITKQRLRQIIKEEMAKIEEDLAIGNLDCAGLQKEYDAAKARLARNANSSLLQQDVRNIEDAASNVRNIEDAASNMGCQDFDFDFEDMTFDPVDPSMIDRDALSGTQEDWEDEFGL
jgi:hypothetical protein